MDVNKSSRIVTTDFESLPWKAHPTVPGVTSRFQELEVTTHPALDAMVARLEAGEWVPWHVHESTCELAYVVEGEGRLHEAVEPPGVGGGATSSAGDAPPGAGDMPPPPADSGRVAHPLRPGIALFIPVGRHHAVENVGTSSLVIFAVHTSPREEEQNNE
ncbi:MAG: hypothetical protein GVY29_13575 [Spirochaetes bacterium]|nr:hypothetical protein [Spirochaetota bacterium]